MGYRKEQFACLTAEYKGVTLIENPYWDSCNNIASLYVAREQLENAMIMDGDQIIYKKEILAPEFTHSGYNAVWTDEKTDEWLMQEGDLIEIDDFSELCDLDPSYCGYEAQGQEKSEEK